MPATAILSYGSGFSFNTILHWIVASAVWHVIGAAFRANPVLTIGAVVVLIIIAVLVRKARKGKRSSGRSRTSTPRNKTASAPTRSRTKTDAEWELEREQQFNARKRANEK
jgi:hypothetical protein